MGLAQSHRTCCHVSALLLLDELAELHTLQTRTPATSKLTNFHLVSTALFAGDLLAAWQISYYRCMGPC
jgi:hypothetical protein